MMSSTRGKGTPRCSRCRRNKNLHQTFHRHEHPCFFVQFNEFKGALWVPDWTEQLCVDLERRADTLIEEAGSDYVWTVSYLWS